MSTYDLITDSIISILEAGEIPPWQREWNANSCIPRNAVTGTSYSGINVINLQLHGMHHGYKTNEWATMRQWATLGASVKGQKGTLGVFFKKCGTTQCSHLASVNNTRTEARHNIFNKP